MEVIMKTTLIIATTLTLGAFAGSAMALDVSHERLLVVGNFSATGETGCTGGVPGPAPVSPCGQAPAAQSPIGCAGVGQANIAARLGSLSFTPLGADGQYCNYLANWTSPFNPNDVQTCILQEARTPFAPSCIMNERCDIVSLVQSSAVCSGFDLKGEATSGVSLLFSESGAGLSGIAVIPSGVPQTYPVTSL
jgi:hypothetical protein